MTSPPPPKRGEIWFGHLPSDPPGKGPRPLLIVSVNGRNLNPRANTVLVVPLTTTQSDNPLRIALSPGETGLSEISTMVPDGITSIQKEFLLAPRTPLRQLSDRRLREVAVSVVRGLGFVVNPSDLR